MASVDLATLKRNASQLVLSVRAVERGRLAAIASGQVQAAEGLRVQVVNTGRSFNDVVRQLQGAEPGVAWLQLARVDDIEIPGATGKTMEIVGDVGRATNSPFKPVADVAKAAGDVLGAGLDAAKGALKTIQILPLLLVGTLIVAGLYFYSKVKR